MTAIAFILGVLTGAFLGVIFLSIFVVNRHIR